MSAITKSAFNNLLQENKGGLFTQAVASGY